MALITMPSSIYFSDVSKLQLQRGGVSLRSRYTGKRQAVAFPFALWAFEGKLLPVEGLDAGEWRAFLTGLEGEQNTFLLPVPGAEVPLSGYTGNLTASAASAVRARSLSFSTGVASITRILEKGDFITVNGELKVVQATCTTDAAGLGTIQFEPGLRVPVTIGTAIQLQNPYCTMSLQDNDGGTWSLSRPTRHGIILKAIEAF